MSGATKLLTAGGGGTILTPASSIASDVTVQVPSANCVLGIQGPVFYAYDNSGTSISSSTWTKITLNTTVFDTDSAFNTSLYRFQPLVAGYYQLSGGWLTATVAGTGSSCYSALYKNGSLFAYLDAVFVNVYSTVRPNGSIIVYMNGSTDYVELYGYSSGFSTSATNGYPYTYFTGSLVRAA